MGRKIVELPLPDTTKWQPKTDNAFKSAFLQRCIDLEKAIKDQVKQEKKYNQYSYDSGSGTEEIIRDEFSQLLPKRYSVRAGTIVDEKGYSSGDSDLIIFNDFWFPIVKAGATTSSRRIFLPIDGVFAVGEVKQTLDYSSLDKAMEKLVTIHRLSRLATNAFRLTENQDPPNAQCSHFLTNPLYSFIIATDVKRGTDVTKIIERFVEINRTLDRLETVSALCVLGRETVTWGVNLPEGLAPAIFRRDIYLPIVPVRHKVVKVKSALYALVANLLLRLNLSILGAEDIARRYGISEYTQFTPQNSEAALAVSAKWLSKKEEQCELGNHNLDE